MTNRSNLQIQRATRQSRQPRSSDVIGCAIKGVMEILSLPPEIIWLILIRLSVESLSAMKCVCKYFSRVITSPKFVTAHLKFSTEDASMSGYRVIVNLYDSVFDYNSHSKLKQTSVQSLITESEPSRTIVDFFYPRVESHSKVQVLGSCNGIVFMIENHRDRFLWNPAIKVYYKLPCIGSGLDPGHVDADRGVCIYINYGFGFDKSNNDYKVVVIFAYECQEYVAYVFSLKRGTWMKVSTFSSGWTAGIFGKLAGGHLHWNTIPMEIVSFDVEREVFGTLEQPTNRKGGYDDLVMLSVLGGSISVSYKYPYMCPSHVDVWVMKEYGVIESWTKMFTLPDDTLPNSILPRGELLLDNAFIDIYNLKDKKIRLRICGCSDPVIYVESLVSPFDEKE